MAEKPLMERVRKTTILIVDDHELVRKGLITLLRNEPEITIVGEAGDGEEAVSKALSIKPDIILMDILLPRLDGMAAAQRIQKKLPGIRIFLLTYITHRESIYQALRMGAAGYLQKDIDSGTLLAALRQTASGKTFICPTMNEEEIAAISRRVKDGAKEYESLTVRERKVLKYLCDGYTSKRIGSLLKISPRVADKLRTNIMDRLGLHTRAQLIKYALRKGIVDMTA